VQFVQVVFCLTAYIILPFTCQFLKSHSALVYTGTVIASAMTTAAFLSHYPWPWLGVYSSLHVTLVFVCPACLLSAHKFKAQINGPWDEAVPHMELLVRESVKALEHIDVQALMD
jgi:phosphatidylinositol N-acetylglucosaminyltransferase subunit C